MILDTTTRQIFATSSRASIIPRRSTRYQRSLIDLSPRKKREREKNTDDGIFEINYPGAKWPVNTAISGNPINKDQLPERV